MKWYAISGSWKTVNKKLEDDVTKRVKKIILLGGGIITGGALGVDYIATNIVLSIGKPEKQLKVFLPIKLDNFCKHYFKRAEEGIITVEQARMITSQLKKIAKAFPDCIFDNSESKEANEKSYYARNTKIIQSCDELYAFQVNNSQGTQDAINKAKQASKPIHIKKYYLKTGQRP